MDDKKMTVENSVQESTKSNSHPMKRQAKIARQQRRMQVARIMLRGVTSQRALADKLGVSQTTIHKDIKVLEKKWIAEQLDNITETKARSLAELDQIIEEAWTAWEKSKKKKHQVTQRKKLDKDGNEFIETTTTVKESTGDVKYLNAALTAIDKRLEIHGLKVHKIAPTSPETRIMPGNRSRIGAAMRLINIAAATVMRGTGVTARMAPKTR